MARQNLSKVGRRPAVDGLIRLEVQRRERISPHLVRVTLGGGEIERFIPTGFDQWFRLFLPVAAGSLEKAPEKLDLLSYLKLLTVAKSERPVVRNYTVRQYRAAGADGPELDVDLVVHGVAEGGTAGPASSWAMACEPGDPVAILDQGFGFNPPAGESHYLLVADESGLPALAAILESLEVGATGTAWVEVPTAEDVLELTAPAGVAVHWLVRGPGTAPGTVALAAVQAAALPTGPAYGWAVGEQALASGARRHWVGQGLPKDRVMFCGYWRIGKAYT